MTQKFIKTATGYKATDKDMKCRGHQFVIGEWSEVEGEIKECGNGFHFCEQPSGVWGYYSNLTTRVFKIEAEGVLDTPFQAGADYKRVARRIRLVEEIFPSDPSKNTGDRNTGDRNTGDGNTGYRNTGYRNTGDRNTGDGNTGDRNTGDGNTGDGNTGDRNTGDGNTGDGNTGDGNSANYSSGFFCLIEPTVICFDKDTGLTRAQFTNRYPSYRQLAEALIGTAEIEFGDFASIPNITPEKLKALHTAHLEGKKS
jgi:Pentapeptide repeats (8 copies)